MKKVLEFSSLVAALSLFLATPVFAQSPCDGESGAAFGLCNAYCEAMDCDGDPEASVTACAQVGAKFSQITERDLPCESTACPCAEAYAQIFTPTGIGVKNCLATGPSNSQFVAEEEVEEDDYTYALVVQGSDLICEIFENGNVDIVQFEDLTGAQFESCRALLPADLQAASSCVPPQD